jgi:uncharacterized protein
MSDGKPEQEPPMEEILASIRRIISESAEPDGPAQRNAAGPEAEKADEDSGDVLELTQMIKEDGSMVDLTKDESDPGAESESDPEPASAAEPETQVELADDLKSEPEGAASESDQEAETGGGDERLVSSGAAEKALKPLSDLARAADPVPPRSRGPSFGDSQRTVEDLVMELMRPMLREWLDENLPDLFERLVQKEIRYLVRRSEPD